MPQAHDDNAEAQADAVEAIRTDVHCHTCGYNLRGLSPDGQCPECGAMIERSLLGNLLRNCSADFVNRIDRGVRLAYGIVFWAVIGILAFIIFTVFYDLARSVGPGSWSEPTSILLAIVCFAPSFVLPVLYPLGWWWATTPDPAEEERDSRVRTLLRWSAILFFIAYPLRSALDLLGFAGGLTNKLAVEFGSHALFAIVAVHIWCVADFALRTFRRCDPPIPAKRRKKYDSIYRRCRKYAIFVPIVLVAIHWASALYWAITGGAAGAPFITAFGFGAGVGFVFISLLWLCVVSVLTYLTKPMRHERLMAVALDEKKADPYSEKAGGIRHRLLETDI